MSMWASVFGQLKTGVFNMAPGTKDFMDVATSVYTTDRIRVSMDCDHSEHAKHLTFYLSPEETDELIERLQEARRRVRTAEENSEEPTACQKP